MSSIKKQTGFTMIEMMIVVAILAIIASIAIPSFAVWIENTRIRTTAESIQNGMQKARTEALRRNTQVRFTLGFNAAWSVGCVTVTATCPAVIESRAATDGGSTNIIFTPLPAGATRLTYGGLGSRVASATEINQLTIDSNKISASDTRELQVTVGLGGNVRTCIPNLPTDIRGC